ncbi:hypothetical protein B566_EDAN018123 [Ephemera danica]|nr:hypothetical protein B566_EDAN018122 [Ephemera danica]KAF4524047.1 hypothetical protein B566_EDAN018123 [Ephemera danica]
MSRPRRRTLLLLLVLAIASALPPSVLGLAIDQDIDTSSSASGGANDIPIQPSKRQNSSRLFFDEFLSLFTAATASSSDDDDDDVTLRNCTCKCGISNSETRIVGGQITGIHRYPWVARLVYDGQFHCGGSLLNGDYVLTAAHCVRR